MKIQILIAAVDNDYSERLSSVLSQDYADTFIVSVCSSPSSLSELLTAHKYDVALLDAELITENLLLSNISLPLLLSENFASVEQINILKIQKYQRVSGLVSDILERYAKILPASTDVRGKKTTRLTAVYSPGGGTGKTSVALAYAAKLAYGGSQVTYFELETFSSIPLYFDNSGKSISSILAGLNEGNIELLLQSVRQKDHLTGISYFCAPETYADMGVLTAEEIKLLFSALAEITDELVADLPNECNEVTQTVLEMANSVLLVTDHTKTSAEKLRQFTTQHNIFAQISEKTALIANKSGRLPEVRTLASAALPLIQSDDCKTVLKMLTEELRRVNI
jgi:cellulose biosynthesis protein BcsQ